MLLVSASAAHASVVVALGFAERYQGPDGSSFTHHGADVAWAEGAEVTTPIAGTVTFAGRVPGPHGGTVNAVSLDTSAGKVTMLPFDRVDVVKGENVRVLDVLGTLAGRGDPSSPGAHLHIGLRKGSVYVDPAVLFAGWAARPSPAPETAPVVVPSPAPAPAPGPVVVPAPGTVPVAVPSPAPAGAPAGAGAGAPAGATVLSPSTAGATAGSLAGATGAVRAGAAGAVSAGGLSGAPVRSGSAVGTGAGALGTARVGIESHGARAGSGVPAVSIGGQASLAAGGGGLGGQEAYGMAGGAPSIGSLTAALVGAVVATLSALAGQPVAAGVCAAALLGVVTLFTRRSLVRRITSEEPVSDRWGNMLRALRAGDTICGFTSCSGHSAFTDPGPPAQRR